MKTRFLAAARAELIEATEFYNSQRAGLGDEFKTEVNATLDRIEFWPHAWTRATKRTRQAGRDDFLR